MSPLRFALLAAMAVAAMAVAAIAGSPATADVLRPSGSAVVRADTVALVLSRQDGGALPLSLLAIPPLPDSESAVVVAEIAGRALAEGHEGPVLRTDVVVYVLGPRNEVLAHEARRFALDLDRHGDELARSGLRVAFVLEVPPGDHRVRLLVRSENGALGLASAELSVGASAFRPLPPLFESPTDSWVTALSESDESAMAKAWKGLAGAAPPLPSSRPVVSAESPGGLVLAAAGYDGPGPTVVVEGDDGVVAEMPLAAPELLAGAPDLTAWRARFDPAGVEPGVYRLSASWGGSRSPSIAVVVTAPGGAAGELWTELDASRLAPETELPPVNVAGASSLAEQEIAAGYLTALRELAAGDRPAALRRLYALETDVLAGWESDALELLEKVEAETLATLLEGAWPALLPVTLLHAEAAAGYRAARHSALVGHSEQMALRLTRTYVERVPGDEARRDASLILAGTAAELRRLGTNARAEWLYRHALDIDPGNEDLVLSIAAIQERWGRYSSAVSTLEGERRHGLGREGRLRLAINLERTGQRAKAERLLRELLREAGDGDDWIGILAVEELAGIELERNDPEAASALLRRGLDRWPGQAALRLLLAYVLDRLERSGEATEILEEIGSRSAPRAGLERVRYNEWPKETADGRREMMERASLRLVELERVFARLAEPAARD